MARRIYLKSTTLIRDVIATMLWVFLLAGISPAEPSVKITRERGGVALGKVEVAFVPIGGDRPPLAHHRHQVAVEEGVDLGPADVELHGGCLRAAFVGELDPAWVTLTLRGVPLACG